MKKILFVCSGNTCRSPLAEGIAKKIFSEGAKFESHISSAGSSARDGLPASPLAIEVAEANSIDLSSHKSRLLNRALVNDADLIVVMAPNHRETVGIIEPSALGHTFLLTDFCDGEEGDVIDPIGLGVEVYKKTFALIERCISGMKKQLKTFDGWKKE